MDLIFNQLASNCTYTSYIIVLALDMPRDWHLRRVEELASDVGTLELVLEQLVSDGGILIHFVGWIDDAKPACLTVKATPSWRANIGLSTC